MTDKTEYPDDAIEIDLTDDKPSRSWESDSNSSVVHLKELSSEPIEVDEEERKPEQKHISDDSISRMDVNELLDLGYVAFEPTLQESKILAGEQSAGSNLCFIMFLVHREKLFKPVLLTTAEAKRNNRAKIRNLKNIAQGFKLNDFIENLSDDETIRALLNDSESDDGNHEDVEVDRDDGYTAAKEMFNNVVGEGLAEGASDFVICYNKAMSYYAFSTDGSMGKKNTLASSDAKAMVNAMFNTESENMTGSLEDEQIMDKNLTYKINFKDKNGRRRVEEVRLRSEKAYAHNGYTLSVRIIKTNQSFQLSLEDLGFEPGQLKTLNYLKDLPTGIILIVGPTGHGKSVTLKAFYEAMNPKWRIVVIEDPVEYIINHPHVTQEPVVPEKGLTIPAYLKAALRQFPKVIGISEIRTGEVADDVINISLSGHKMVATMHANDSLAVLPRLNTIGVSFQKQAQEGLFSASMSQRLLPKLCEHCKVPHSHESYGEIFIKSQKGCENCDYKGIKGRQLIGEIVIFDSTVRRLLKEDRYNDVLPYIKSKGWRSMEDVGLSKVQEGIVDPTDLFTALGDSENTHTSEYSYSAMRFQTVEEKIDASTNGGANG